MPSGAKKRKAARRKKEMALPSADPSSQDSGHSDELMPAEDSKESDDGSPTSSSSSSSSQEHHRSRSAEELLGSDAVVFDSTAESGKGVALAEEVEAESPVAVEEAAYTTTVESFAESEDVVVEFPKSEKEDEEVAEESAVLVEKVVALAEEDRRLDEVAAKVLEETSGGVKEVPLPDGDEAVDQLGESGDARCVAGKAENLPTAEVSPGAAPVVHHATWWNCCGLLDVFACSTR
ncbi:unnamed protein product [Musa banksii]